MWDFAITHKPGQTTILQRMPEGGERQVGYMMGVDVADRTLRASYVSHIIDRYWPVRHESIELDVFFRDSYDMAFDRFQVSVNRQFWEQADEHDRIVYLRDKKAV